MSEYDKCIKDIADIFDGPHATPEKTASGPYYLSISSLNKGRLDLAQSAFLSENDFEKWTKRVTPKEGDILFSYETRLGEVALMPGEIKACLGRRMGILRPKKDKVLPEYLLYAYLSPKFQQTIISKTIRGATVDRIALNELPNFTIRIPDLSEQRKVSFLLSNIDSKIALNNRINAELEAMAKTVYDYWFVQFDFPAPSPSGRAGEGSPYKSSGGKMVWCEELKREVPEGWKVDIIKNVIEVKDGTHDSPKAKSEGFRLITSKNLLPSGLDFESANFISKEDYININKRSKVDTGDILFSMIGSIGVVYKVEDEEINFAVKNVALYKTSQKPDYKNYIYQYLKSYDMQNYMGNVISGSIQKFISLGSLRNMPLLINDDIILKFQKATEHLFVQLENNKKQNQQLSSLRDWLLPMLMNGQVSVGAQPLASVGRQTSSEVERLMAAEPGVEYLSTGKNNSTTSFKQWTIGERTILAAYLIKKFNGKGFGRVMLMKLLFLVEYMCELDFDSQYKVNVAGPYDDLIREIELKLRTHKLYDAKQNKFDNHVTYEEMGGTTNVESLYYENFSQEVSPINSILEKFKNSHWDQCEIIATMYAVWNNRLIKGSPINDMALKQDFLNWDPNKEKYKDRLDSALTWMRSYEVVPKGWGKVIDK